MKTYPEMNAKIVGLLRICDDKTLILYAAQRIEELQAENDQLRVILSDVTRQPGEYIHNVHCSKQSGPRRDCSVCSALEHPHDVIVKENERICDAINDASRTYVNQEHEICHLKTVNKRLREELSNTKGDQ